MKTINHECYVSLEVAKLLKQAGFDWETREYYKPIKEGYKLDWNSLPVNWNQKVAILIAQKHNHPEGYSAPTLDVAQRWLREVKGVEVNVLCVYIGNDKKYSYDAFEGKYNHELIKEGFDTYEEALEAGIKIVLELILEKGE